ncbi:odorant receptor 42a-like [Periplaneta americana]|uniref:odorant receptor 42a-like n=1 Tax=Periplaneta americana TaxID=6978 RepID=UPI0037E78783
MLSVMLFGVFFIFLLTSCSASFSAVMSLEDVPDFSQCVAIYMLVIIGTSIFCGFGTLLSEEYEAMKNAAWSSDWIGSPVPYQRCILFIMSVSNKGLNFMAGKIVPVTNSTLMGMLNESMSLFMFLLTMKDKSEKSSLEK